ncbi:MAG: preprotein translocase subunit SecE [Clostridiales bacterium]|nr:preprotein translocase subunit SecE [Clostridiales bacterium]
MGDKKAEKTAVAKKAEKADKKPGKLAAIGKYFRACWGEVKKIVWPTPKATFKNTGVVLAIVIIAGLFIFALDRGLYALLQLVMNISVS